MKGGWYCTDCGALHDRLPAGAVTCRQCGHLGLRGYNRRPFRITCTSHPSWRGWDDGGVNNDMALHRRREHGDNRP